MYLPSYENWMFHEKKKLLYFIFRMPYQEGFTRVFGDRLTHLSHGTTEEQIKHTYNNWASVYDKVTE